MKTVYVVMGNDYPAEVFSNETAAEAYAEKKRQEGKRIYWRVYEFQLRDECP